jgi:hypothetical protein
MEWIDLAQYKTNRQDAVNTVMNTCVMFDKIQPENGSSDMFRRACATLRKYNKPYYISTRLAMYS